jgi:deoxyribose-phosphate aldolase
MITKSDFFHMQDHSLLGHVCTKEMVRQCCDDVIKYDFACAMLDPDNVAYAASILGGRAGIGSVISFPWGISTTRIKITEGLDAIANGATDLDLVTNFSRLVEKDDAYVLNEYKTFVQAARDRKPDVIVKIIMYLPCGTGRLTEDETCRVSEMIMESGADYIKFAWDFSLIRSIVGNRIKMKHSGCAGLAEAIDAVSKGCTRIGHCDAPNWFADDLWGK